VASAEEANEDDGVVEHGEANTGVVAFTGLERGDDRPFFPALEDVVDLLLRRRPRPPGDGGAASAFNGGTGEECGGTAVEGGGAGSTRRPHTDPCWWRGRAASLHESPEWRPPHLKQRGL